MSFNKRVILSVDAETVGLYGEPFAIGFVVVNHKGVEIEKDYLSCPFETAKGQESSREWVGKHVIPALPKETQYRNPEELCEAFYRKWLQVKESYEEVLTIADCHYPVETGLFRRMIKADEKTREFTGPYPFHEVATAIMTARMDLKDYPRKSNELPVHHPVYDARYAARLFLVALNKTKLLHQLNKLFNQME